MKNLFDSNVVRYAGIGALVVIAFAAIFWASSTGTGPSGPQAVRLPPIANANIQPGFVGSQPFGLWTLSCQNMKPSATPPAAGQEAPPKRICRTNARMTVRGPNNAILLAAGFNVLMMDTKKVPAIMFRVPPSASAADSANFMIDEKTMFKAPLRCTKTECIVQGALPPEALAQMKAGKTLSLIYTIKDRQQQDKKVRVDQLLHGFSQSYDAMTRAISA
ncbi:MAG: invasion associated locus B family protein [Alphaproteobacteria bacterium]|nr:invasion associated locus B family protein [Alphaproteobacteria bacterium]